MRSRFPVLAATAMAVIFGLSGFAEAAGAAEPSAPALPPQDRSQRPNVLVWMLDDVGFAQLSSFGGLVETPNIDRVAEAGLRYANYRTSPICSASRAAFLSGRNPHSIHVGGHLASPRPISGYDGRIPQEAGTLAANLKAAGYVTYALGKWDHALPRTVSPAGPFDYWPTNQGFDRFYGFLAADTDNWTPVLMSDKTPLPAPEEADYHLNNDLADAAISLVNSRNVQHTPQPFFIYFATGTAHAPHHAPDSWIKRYKGKFDAGWDKAREEILQRQKAMGLMPESATLAPLPDSVPAWDSLSADQKRLYSRQMEVFAASLGHADEQFGRILDALEAAGELENTIVIITSDNGASAEGAAHGTYNESLFLNGYYASVADNLPFLDKWGGPETYPHYSLGWAVAGNTPFRYYKQTTYEGGIRVPLIIAWPKGIKSRGELRHQFAYVADIAPTVMELADAPLAEVLNNVRQDPMEGISLSYSFTDPAAAERRQAQYFELYGNKGLWSDGWMIVTAHRTKTWEMAAAGDPADDPWELYNLAEDPGQTRNLAGENAAKVKEMAALFEEQIRQFNAWPVDNFSSSRNFVAAQKQLEFTERDGVWSFPGPVSYLSQEAAPPTSFRAFRMSARVKLATGKESGPVFAQGGDLGGMALYLKNGAPRFIFRGFDGKELVVAASRRLPRGESRLELEVDREPMVKFAASEIGIRIKLDGRTVAEETLSVSMPAIFSLSETFDIGNDWGSTVAPWHQSGRAFPGEITDVVFDFNQQAAPGPSDAAARQE